jgi:hypothetical protein
MPVMDGFFLFIKELQNAQNQLWQATIIAVMVEMIWF